MALLGKLLKKGIILRESLEQKYTSPADLQNTELRKLLIAAQGTQFGRYYDFGELLDQSMPKSDVEFYEDYKKFVPVHDYNRMYNEWWHKLLNLERNVTWPGKTKYFALSSGTSEASSKHIPVTKEMLKSMRRTALRQTLTLPKYDISDEIFGKGILMLGGSTDLRRNAGYFEGDLSGITTSRLPLWVARFYKPGKKISKTHDWGEKLEEITQNAKNWDIGIIVGVPAWFQILLEKIISHYELETIHDLWPNLSVFVHGGVAFDPYKKGFEKLLGKPIHYIETYLASEGFLAFQSYPNSSGMKLVLNSGIFYEFVAFNDQNFDGDGSIRENAKALKIDQVREGVDYALLISTKAGAWRYLIGDVVKFLSVPDVEIVITGRVKHFLSLCGEHLSVDNMNKAIELTADDLNIGIREFTVLGEPNESLFSHHWFVGTDATVSEQLFKSTLDNHLKTLNDDYAVERAHALKEIQVELLPPHLFIDWLRANGKEGGQNKFPRVLKGEKAESWKQFLENQTVVSWAH